MRTRFDALLARFTMYRTMTIALTVLALTALIYSLLGQVGFPATAMLASAAVLLSVTYLSNRLMAVMFGVQPHPESSVITALLLFFILQPSTDVVVLLQIALAALFASASKYLLAFRGRHIFNPAAVGALWLTIFHFYLAFWWIGTPALLPFTLVLGLLILYRTRRTPVGATFILIAGAILLLRNLSDGASFADAVKFAVGQSPLIFFAGFMLSEPLTLPPTRPQQLAVAALVAVLFAVPITVGSFVVGPECALVLGNLAAFMVGQRRGIDLVMTGKTEITPTATEFEFRPVRPVRYRPGQYLELTIPHHKTDTRGSRRSFSIVSTPGGDGLLRIAIKVPERASSFKRALSEVEIGSTLRATGVYGDFLLPRDRSEPLLLVAGGIGITPFISQLGALEAADPRDVVVVYAAGDSREVGYAAELERSGARVVVVARDSDAALPATFDVVVAPRIDLAVLRAAVPDIARRRVFVSGPPALVDSIGAFAAELKARRVRKDYFTGY